MGLAQSKSNSFNSSVAESISNVLIQNKSDCSNALTQSQSIDVGDATGNLIFEGNTQKSEATVNLSCLTTIVNDSNLQSKLDTAIKQVVKSENSGINGLASNSVSDAISQSVQRVVQTININNISNCATKLLQTQSLKGGNALNGDIIVRNNTQVLTATQVAECVTNNSSTQSAITDLKQVVDQESSASNLVLFGGVGAVIIIIIIIIIIMLRKNSK